jgi:hypothetical protein
MCIETIFFDTNATSHCRINVIDISELTTRLENVDKALEDTHRWDG